MPRIDVRCCFGFGVEDMTSSSFGARVQLPLNSSAREMTAEGGNMRFQLGYGKR